jgi:bifunctional DNA-binding transcriptional regulator/antitoxin component of YhaV-PrlF toxin-antitoxin module
MFGERTWTRLVSQSCHGRVTIPIEFRRTLGILDAEMLEMTVEGGELRIRRVESSARTAGAMIGRGEFAAKDPPAGDIARPMAQATANGE